MELCKYGTTKKLYKILSYCNTMVNKYYDLFANIQFTKQWTKKYDLAIKKYVHNTFPFLFYIIYLMYLIIIYDIHIL